LDFSPLASAESVEDVHNYAHWPSADQWDYDNVPAKIEAIRQKAGDVFIWNGGDRVDRTAQLKPMMYLRGIQETFFDLGLRPEMVEAIVGHIHDYFMDYNTRTFEASRGLIDGFFCGDDMGSQQGPLISVDMYRRYFKDRFCDHVALAHEYQLPVMYHTCGSVRALIPEFIECKLDVLQSLQPQAHDMDLCVLKKSMDVYSLFKGVGTSRESFRKDRRPTYAEWFAAWSSVERQMADTSLALRTTSSQTHRLNR